ncbi:MULTISPECIES: hypothetical protein [Streptomyces]|uniref:Uncharacterized protein n=1 Tax=Streptomyces dengpaensis TaxID=2049881 RepID=A0ABM6SZ73_9ACTN|nr:MULTISPECIES: hypothetical protein [Streptomyces]AVH59946.1 hypothetical protein C4B68_33895 [Streptomyces dengpaensis]PIB09581.1 hypothetical protein B1C81_10570 [Streptomyces sp. HG99]
MTETTNPQPDRVTAIYDAIDAFQRTHRTGGGLQHAQIRALLAEHLDRALPTAPAAVPSAPADRVAILREAAQRLYTALFPAVYDDMGQKAAEGVNRAVSELRRMADDEQIGLRLPDHTVNEEAHPLDCDECGHPSAVHSTGEDPVSPGECSLCPDGEQTHDYRPDPGTVAAPPTEQRKPVDRAAVLHEASAAVMALDYHELRADFEYDSQRDAWDGGTIDAAQLLSCMAKEAESTTNELPGDEAQQQESESGCAHCVCCHAWGDCEAQQPETQAPVRVETLARLLCDADTALTDGPSWDRISQTPGLGRDEYRNAARYLLRKVTVTQADNGSVECGDQIPGMTCTLPDGPHDDWKHRDEEGHWWSQMRVPPHNNRDRLAAEPAAVSQPGKEA